MLPIHVDCRFYTGSSPCRFHKADGRSCPGCADYDPIRTRLLILKLAAAGDVLRTTSLLPAMRRAFPHAQITWITDRACAPVLEHHPLIDRLLTADNCVPALSTERFDIVYGLDADGRSAALSTMARATRRIGYFCDEGGRVTPAADSAVAWWLMGLDDRLKRANRLTYQQLMYELCGLDGEIAPPLFVVPEASRARAREFRQARPFDAFRAVIGLNTGGGSRWAQKKWTPEGYEAFIALTRVRHPEVAVLLLGGPEEAALNAHLMSTAPAGVFDGGCNNTFADFAALIESADVLVTSDSLGLHAAVAVGTPVVAFVGPTAPWELEVYGRGRVVHAEGVECLACYRAACDKPVTCMERLDPSAVLGETERLLPVPIVAPPQWLPTAAPHPA